MTKLVALILLGVPFIGIGGFLYKRAAKGITWKEAMFKSYAVSQNIPGEQAKASNDCFALLTTGASLCRLNHTAAVSAYLMSFVSQLETLVYTSMDSKVSKGHLALQVCLCDQSC